MGMKTDIEDLLEPVAPLLVPLGFALDDTRTLTHWIWTDDLYIVGHSWESVQEVVCSVSGTFVEGFLDWKDNSVKLLCFSTTTLFFLHTWTLFCRHKLYASLLFRKPWRLVSSLPQMAAN